MKQEINPILSEKTKQVEKLTPEEKLKKVLKAKLKLKMDAWDRVKKLWDSKSSQKSMTTTIINQALIELLIEKGILSGQELMDKIEEIKKNLPAERVDN